ncbi:5-hydroxytryptamine receptor 1A-alpha-like [Liolophura sinensis]|uniref:5-hydroxytryptamine receptor 1A-alpha-like n=1 Tax=Liolophura sinensis TaxID=3198878 RepID=UPI0031593B48
MAETVGKSGWENMGDDNQFRENNYPEVLRTWAVAIPLMFLVLVTVTGNGTVIVMFFRMTKLRNFKNSFIANLAIADFLVGCTEPVSVLETVRGEWPSGIVGCHVFLVVRYSLCYMSLWSILFISLDRWWSIHHPFSYRVRRSKRLAMWAIACGWTLSFIVHILPIISWHIQGNHKNLNQDIPTNSNTDAREELARETLCLHPFRQDFTFTTVAVSLEFILLLLALVSLNVSVFVKIRRRKATKIRRSLSTSEYCFHMSRKSSSDSENTIAEDDHGFFRRQENRFLTYKQYKPMARRHTLAQDILHAGVSASHLARLASSRKVSFDVTVLAQPLALRKSSHHSVISRNSLSPCTGYTRRQSTGEELVRDLMIRQDKKAACSLGLLVFVLTVCWAPLCVCSIIYSFDSSFIPAWALAVTQWLTACNSALNPFLYAIGNAEFRKVIKSWIGCVDTGPFKYHKAFLYHSIQLPTDGENTREPTTPNLSKD